MPIPTLGGRQFWSDVQFFHGWSIQRNIFTGHYRLLDPRNLRYASGTLEECRATLDHLRAQHNLPPMSGRAVILVHGIFRSADSMQSIGRLCSHAGYQVFGFDYPSTQQTIADAAVDLHEVLSHLDGIEEINFVVHSMGGLVVRAYLAEHSDTRIRRMVMLGVPNMGACLADRLQKNLMYRALYGPAGQQLITDQDGFIASLPTPEFEFAVIAGGRAGGMGFNWLIDGDDDGTVSVACTQLPGAADFAIVPCLHSFLVTDRSVGGMTLRFLETGRLRADGPAQPIAAAPQAAPAAPSTGRR